MNWNYLNTILLSIICFLTISIFLIDISDIISTLKLNKKTRLSPLNYEYIFYRAIVRLIYENTIRNHFVNSKNKDMISKQYLTSCLLGIIETESLIYNVFRRLEQTVELDLSFMENINEHRVKVNVEHILRNKILITIKNKVEVGKK